jgi:FG-GAP-like repeat
MRELALLLALSATATPPMAAAADFPAFATQEIDPHAGQVCYAVAVADVNGDQKPDVVVVTEDSVLWYQNPDWKRQEIIKRQTARDNVCIQPHDIDDDGRIDFALGAGWRPTDTAHPGTLQWLGRDKEGLWQVHPIRFDEPTLHRLRWGDVQGTGRKQLVVAPLQGRGTKGPAWGEGQGARIMVYDVPAIAASLEWKEEVADSSLHTIHNIQLLDLDDDHRDEIVVACWEGVFVLDRGEAGHWTKVRIGAGNQEARPSKGASEVKVGRLRNRSVYVATIEPWHGFQVVAYRPKTSSADSPAGGLLAGLWSRQVVAEPLQWGHAVWCADLDGDGDDEVVIGQRDPNPAGSQAPRGPGVYVFDPNVNGDSLTFERHSVDEGGMACEDAVAADLNGDGRLDIVAGGRATHNVRIYWNRAR